MKIDWFEFAKQQLRKDSGRYKEFQLIGMIEGITENEGYTDKEKLKTIKDLLKCYNEITKDLLKLEY